MHDIIGKTFVVVEQETKQVWVKLLHGLYELTFSWDTFPVCTIPWHGFRFWQPLYVLVGEHLFKNNLFTFRNSLTK